jgi:Na+-driven multidrug efflux pump
MIVLRLLLVLSLAVIAGLALAWLFTKDAKYLRIAARILRFIVVLGVVVALIYVVERLLLI